MTCNFTKYITLTPFFFWQFTNANQLLSFSISGILVTNVLIGFMSCLEKKSQHFLNDAFQSYYDLSQVN